LPSQISPPNAPHRTPTQTRPDASRVTALALESGDELWSQKLPASPVPWGMAVDADGRVILSLVDGRVVCIGKPM